MYYVCPTWCNKHFFFLFSLRKRLSVSESSHTESDSSPPLTVRRRCCSAIIEMPRFAISSEEDGGVGGRKTPVRGPRGEDLPQAIPELPVERELRLDESPTTPGSTSSQISQSTLTRQSCWITLGSVCSSFSYKKNSRQVRFNEA